MMLSFTLLGHPILLKNGEPLNNFRSQKEAALLIYLAQTGKTHQREFLAELLWDGRSTKQSLSNLRTALSRLRKQLGKALQITRKTVGFTPENQPQVDAVTLLQYLADVDQISSAETAASLQTTLEAYRGDFLIDFDLSDAPQFEEWVLVTREHIRRKVVAAYNKLGQFLLSTGDIENGLAVARRWHKIDSLDEAAHMLLIQLLLKAGNVQEAVAHYDRCVELLRAELNIQPSAAMTALIQNARRPRLTIQTMQTAVRHNLPPAYDQFFGRQAARQEIQIRLDQPWCRLITITGQGGVGKTRLATNIARSRLNQYRDGVWLVELENIDPHDEELAEAIAVEIATILDLRLTGSATPLNQLLDHLQHKQLMLVLDNFEHLLEGKQIVLDIVQRCEKVQIIVTSREALRLRAEWSIALTGLSYPNNESDEMPSDAVELFAARRAQRQRGAISADELAAVRTICRMVAGLPLAIELAAALTYKTTCRAVANQLQDGFDALAASLHDVPERHRGLHIVFEMSWKTLSPPLQQQLARLSIFRGGFTEAAAQEITGAEEASLAALIEKSLLTRSQTSERFSLHPVIRAYAAEKREANDPTPHKHAHYYLTLLAQHTEPLQKERPQESMLLLEPDIENIRRAWQTGLSAQKGDLLLNALTPFSIYFQLRGLAHEGEAMMHNTMSAATDWEDECAPLVIHAGLERARFQNRLGQYRPAIQTIQTTLKLAEQCGDRWAEGMGHVWWGESLWRLGNYNTAKEKLTHALNIGTRLDATEIIGWSHHQLGIIYDIQTRHDTALDHLEKACTAWRKADNLQGLSGSLNSVGLVYYHQGNLMPAQQAMEQAFAICEQLDDRHRQSSLVNNLSMVLLEQGDFAGAQYYLQLGLELATVTGNLTVQGEIYLNLGRNYLLQDQSNLAVSSLEHGIQIAESVGSRSLMATATFHLAEARKEQGNFNHAESLYDQALTMAQQDHLQSLECEALIGMAKLLGEIDKKRAKQYVVQAVEVAKAIKNPQLLKRTNDVIAGLDINEGK